MKTSRLCSVPESFHMISKTLGLVFEALIGQAAHGPSLALGQMDSASSITSLFKTHFYCLEFS